MEEQAWLAKRFEENRGHLKAVAYRMLGSVTEADRPEVVAPLVLVGLALVSWALRPPSRVLGVSLTNASNRSVTPIESRTAA